MSAYPTSIAEQVVLRLEQGLTYKRNAKVSLYAGELFDMQQIQRLAKDVRQRPTFFVDVHAVQPVGDPRSRHPKDRIEIDIYCCASDYRSEIEQNSASYQRANDARRIICGTEISAEPGVHSNGYIEFEGFEKDLHVPGLSVHMLAVSVDVTYNLND